MALSVSLARIKAKCGVSCSDQDAALQALIDEVLPALEASLQASAVSGSNSGVLAICNLGATEWIAGEALAERLREVGAADTVSVDGFELRPPVRDLADPSGLKAQGMARLMPFWRTGAATQGGGVLST